MSFRSFGKGQLIGGRLNVKRWIEQRVRVKRIIDLRAMNTKGGQNEKRGEERRYVRIQRRRVIYLTRAFSHAVGPVKRYKR